MASPISRRRTPSASTNRPPSPPRGITCIAMGGADDRCCNCHSARLLSIPLLGRRSSSPNLLERLLLPISAVKAPLLDYPLGPHHSLRDSAQLLP